MSALAAVVMAAGQGKRMKSALPKVLHRAAGRAIVYYPIRAALDAGASEVVVVVSPETREPIEALLRADFGNLVRVAVQEVPRGTGDAARVGIEGISAERVLVLCGDTPLLQAAELARLVSMASSDKVAMALLSCRLDEPAGYGRVLRDAGQKVVGIREDRDLRSAEERAISEVNAGVYAARRQPLVEALSALTADNAQKELYLTDTVAALARSQDVLGVVGDPDGLSGVNDRAQLALVEELLFRSIARRHAVAGATVALGARIEDSVEIGVDAQIEANVCLRGKTRIAGGVKIDVGCVVTDSAIGEGAHLQPYTVVSSSKIGARAKLGPFAHVRPDSDLREDVHLGNFVETKKTVMHAGSKANHLAYLGDGEIGARSNIGAGTIFCNYDGFGKHRTTIEEDVFIGSDTQLVAPVRIGKGAYVATGTTVVADVPPEALAIGRARQETKPDYAPKLREKLKARKK
jgi:bifunctional UDP-N-acetylglucosamine pyrophosphorylase / glucosamine-1-phosphate N-acetyltransferase